MALIDFIIAAKIKGYATGGETDELTFDDGATGFQYAADGYTYTDRYYGFNPFAGTEHIYDGDHALIWKMNYYGEIVSAAPDPNKIYRFLREAMSLITPEYPFRGPAAFSSGEWAYRNQQNGSLNRFSGTETIFKGDRKVYYLHYHGGRM